MSQVAIYKGRKYRLKWQGKTKFGERAKLEFFDGSKEFWVDASAVKVVAGGSSSGGKGGLCDECGQPSRRLVECFDSSGIPGRCCPRCASMSNYDRSFA